MSYTRPSWVSAFLACRYRGDTFGKRKRRLFHAPKGDKPSTTKLRQRGTAAKLQARNPYIFAALTTSLKRPSTASSALLFVSSFNILFVVTKDYPVAPRHTSSILIARWVQIPSHPADLSCMRTRCLNRVHRKASSICKPCTALQQPAISGQAQPIEFAVPPSSILQYIHHTANHPALQSPCQQRPTDPSINHETD